MSCIHKPLVIPEGKTNTSSESRRKHKVFSGLRMIQITSSELEETQNYINIINNIHKAGKHIHVNIIMLMSP